jgi:hypothetical protein
MKVNGTTNERSYERRNRLNGESYMLNQQESIVHDRLLYNKILATLEDKKVGIDGYSKKWDKVRQDLNWFRKNNASAYMVLLD